MPACRRQVSHLLGQGFAVLGGKGGKGGKVGILGPPYGGSAPSDQRLPGEYTRAVRGLLLRSFEQVMSATLLPLHDLPIRIFLDDLPIAELPEVAPANMNHDARYGYAGEGPF